jgi:hypothetical protein
MFKQSSIPIGISVICANQVYYVLSLSADVQAPRFMWRSDHGQTDLLRLSVRTPEQKYKYTLDGPVLLLIIPLPNTHLQQTSTFPPSYTCPMESAKVIRRHAKAALTSVLLYTSHPNYASLGMTLIMPKVCASSSRKH